VKHKRTVALERAQAEAAVKIGDALGAEAFGGDAHALLMAVYKDPSQSIELRVQAAKAAIGYEKPRLTAVDAKIDEDYLKALREQRNGRRAL
jgi:nicotinic acid phosphoribosyltransferase